MTATPSNQVPEKISDASAIIHMIERVARDPSVDLDRLERLIAMKERMVEREAENAFNAAMAAAQAEMQPVAADSDNPQTRSKYASFYAIDRALRPIYTQHGFSLSFDTAEGAADLHVRMICRVSHMAGHSRVYHADMPADGKGAKGADVMTKTHATGSAMSYGMRYLLKMIFNVAVGEGDDDGNEAGAREKLSEAQCDELRDLLEATGADRVKFLKWAKVEKIEDVPLVQFAACVEAINHYREKRS